MQQIGYGLFIIAAGILMAIYSSTLIRMTTEGQKDLFGLDFNPKKYQWVYVVIGVLLIVFGGFTLAGKIEFDSEKIRINKCHQKQGVWDPQKKECTQTPLPD